MLNVAQLANNLTRLFNNIFTRLTTLEQGGGGGGGDVTGEEISTATQEVAADFLIFPYKYKAVAGLVQDINDPAAYKYISSELGGTEEGTMSPNSYNAQPWDIPVNILGIFFDNSQGYSIQFIVKSTLDENSLNIKALRIEGVLLDELVDLQTMPMGGATGYIYTFRGNDLSVEGLWPGDAVNIDVEIADV